MNDKAPDEDVAADRADHREARVVRDPRVQTAVVRRVELVEANDVDVLAHVDDPLRRRVQDLLDAVALGKVLGAWEAHIPLRNAQILRHCKAERRGIGGSGGIGGRRHH